MTPTLRKRKAKETAPEPAPEPAKRSRKAPKKVPKEKKVPTEKHDIGPSYPPKVEYRRWPKQDPPITEIEKVPKSWKWNADDNDLDDDDIDGHIARCEERIDTGIMPALWEHQLQVYKDRREAREEILALAPSRPYVAQRLHSLYRILKDLTENGDDVEQIPNAKAIIAAYESGELEWFDDNRVTYWHKGKQICEPKEWDTDDFVKAARKANGKGFWVEGVGF
ncbi:hypothetical protein N7486_001636 [Penicillium sp. IBT 16267x]|nr:hypothetical protein N7486_001636 [Penicillium sp. IBT 16267x]